VAFRELGEGGVSCCSSRELRAIGDTMKQRRSDLSLQIFDLLTERRLADADLGGGAREVTFLSAAAREVYRVG
jgi:hypothetical protein